MHAVSSRMYLLSDIEQSFIVYLVTMLRMRGHGDASSHDVTIKQINSREYVVSMSSMSSSEQTSIVKLKLNGENEKVMTKG